MYTCLLQNDCGSMCLHQLKLCYSFGCFYVSLNVNVVENTPKTAHFYLVIAYALECKHSATVCD